MLPSRSIMHSLENLPKNIWCVGRNYALHAKELNNPIPQTPLIFLKAGSTINIDKTIHLPSWTSDIHHECELAIQVDKNGTPKKFGLALDLTARSVQNELKKQQAPWTLAKSFTGACPVSSFVDWVSFADFCTLQFRFYRNGTLLQSGSPQDMIFSAQELLNYIALHFPMETDDLILTGTPAGVGPLTPGDHLVGEILSREGFSLLHVTWDVM